MVDIMTANIIYYPYFVAQCTFTQCRIFDSDIEEAWRHFLWKTADIWAKDGKDGMCYGADAFGKKLDPEFSKRHCFFVKKQSGQMLDYVRSPAYMEYANSVRAKLTSKQ